MRNFDLIAEGLDIMPLRHAVARQPGMWNANSLRTTHPGTVHGEADDIWLRFDPTGNLDTVIDGYESVDYPAFAALPQARPIVFDLMRRVEGVRLGQVLITRLKPGGRIYPHEDAGDHAAYYERYQISLQGLPGCVFRAGGEQLTMASGEVWWFDNGQTHEVVNNSAGDRIHMIVDIRT